MTDATLTIFDIDQPEPVIDETKDYLSELVGDDKKYKTPADLAKSRIYADMHIARLEKEAQELRAEVKVRKSVEEFMTKMNETKNDTTTTSSSETNENEQVDASKALDELVEAKLTERETLRTQKQNIQKVSEVLSAKLGPNWQQALVDKAKELEVNQAWLDDMAKTRPNALLKIMGTVEPTKVEQSTPSLFQTPPGRGSNPSAPVLSGGTKNFQYYEKLRKTNKDQYYSADIQNQMFAQALQLGEDFYKQ